MQNATKESLFGWKRRKPNFDVIIAVDQERKIHEAFVHQSADCCLASGKHFKKDTWGTINVYLSNEITLTS